jgi:hypothetical protein
VAVRDPKLWNGTQESPDGQVDARRGDELPGKCQATEKLPADGLSAEYGADSDAGGVSPQCTAMAVPIMLTSLTGK